MQYTGSFCAFQMKSNILTFFMSYRPIPQLYPRDNLNFDVAHNDNVLFSIL